MSKEQTTSATAVIWIVLKDLPTSDGFQNVIESDILRIHFFLGVLCDADGLS